MSDPIASLAVPLLVLCASLLPSGVPTDVTLTGKECRIKTDLKPKQAKEVPERIDRYCENFAKFYDELGLKPRASNKVVIRLFARYERLRGLLPAHRVGTGLAPGVLLALAERRRVLPRP